jgi:hypothetical protein
MTPIRLDPLRAAIAERDLRAAAAVDFVDSNLKIWRASGWPRMLRQVAHAPAQTRPLVR